VNLTAITSKRLSFQTVAVLDKYEVLKQYLGNLRNPRVKVWVWMLYGFVWIFGISPILMQ
jgi:hypothetical protein